jgi:hypothetical protein
MTTTQQAQQQPHGREQMQRDGAPGADRSHRGFRTPTLADWRRMSHCARNVSIDADARRFRTSIAIKKRNRRSWQRRRDATEDATERPQRCDVNKYLDNSIDAEPIMMSTLRRGSRGTIATSACGTPHRPSRPAAARAAPGNMQHATRNTRNMQHAATQHAASRSAQRRCTGTIAGHAAGPAAGVAS